MEKHFIVFLSQSLRLGKRGTNEPHKRKTRNVIFLSRYRWLFFPRCLWAILTSDTTKMYLFPRRTNKSYDERPLFLSLEQKNVFNLGVW